MRYHELKRKLYEDDEAPAPDANADEGGGDEGEDTDPNAAGDAEYLNAVSGGGDDAGSDAGGDTAPDSPPDAGADASTDAVDSDENKSKKEPNPIAVKPYSERITTTINLLKEFGYYDVDYQIQDGNNSIITIAGTLTDQHLSDIKRFCGEIRVNCTVASSKIDDDKFITTITVSNKSNLKSFKDIVSGGGDGGAPVEGGSEAGGGDMGGGDMGGGEPAPEGGGEEAVPAEGGGEAEATPAEGGGEEAPPA